MRLLKRFSATENEVYKNRQKVPELANVRGTEEEKQRTERVIQASKDE